MNTKTLQQTNNRKTTKELSHYNRMKYLLLLFSASLLLNIFLTSCDDGYSLNNLYADYGIINKNGQDYTITLDNGAVIYPSVSAVPLDELKDSARVIVNYTILADADTNLKIDYLVKVNDIYKILTKNILGYTPLISDSLGYDPVSFNNIWIRNGYINFDFFFTGGATRHMLNLAKHPGKTDDDRILLEFRHNAFEDPYNYHYRSLVAFPTRQIIADITQDSVLLRIKYHNYDTVSAIDITWFPASDKIVQRTPLKKNTAYPDPQLCQ